MTGQMLMHVLHSLQNSVVPNVTQQRVSHSCGVCSSAICLWIGVSELLSSLGNDKLIALMWSTYKVLWRFYWSQCLL